MKDATLAAASTDLEPSAKRLKTAQAATTANGTAGVIRQELLSAGSRTQLRHDHDTSSPYTHVVLKDVYDEQLLRSVRDEVIHNITATYKETDLFKVFQTGDLANLDKLDPESAAKLPNLMRLRGAIYSQEFRKFVEDITGVGDLSGEKTDLSCNVYAQGGHLLNHDDVISTRAVSFIIYLTDPDDPWSDSDGGALELYPLVQGVPHTPDVVPTTCHLPIWNTMAMFVVQPGKSFHSVQEVLSPDKPRFSISGWYHKASPQEGSQHASLQQLQLKAGEDQIQQHEDFEGGNTGADLTESDLSLLRKWVNPAYLKQESWAKISSKMDEDGSVQLQRFLLKDISDQILKCCLDTDLQDEVGGGKIPIFETGYGNGWAAVGPPHKQRYLRYAGPTHHSDAAAADAAANGSTAAAVNGSTAGAGAAGSSAGGLLAAVKRDLFESGAFARLLKAMLDVQILKHAGEVRRFRAGLDYTVAHYGIITSSPRLDCVLTFVDDTTTTAAEGWQVGEIGGFEAYLLADEDEETAGAAAVYRQDSNDSAVINVPAASSSLNLLMRDEGLMKFVKYVSAQAPGSRWDIAMEYVPEDDGIDPPMPEMTEDIAAATAAAAANGDETLPPPAAAAAAAAADTQQAANGGV